MKLVATDCIELEDRRQAMEQFCYGGRAGYPSKLE